MGVEKQWRLVMPWCLAVFLLLISKLAQATLLGPEDGTEAGLPPPSTTSLALPTTSTMRYRKRKKKCPMLPMKLRNTSQTFGSSTKWRLLSPTFRLVQASLRQSWIWQRTLSRQFISESRLSTSIRMNRTLFTI